MGLDKLIYLAKNHHIDLKADEDVDTDDEFLVRGVSHCVKDLMSMKIVLEKEKEVQ